MTCNLSYLKDRFSFSPERMPEVGGCKGEGGGILLHFLGPFPLAPIPIHPRYGEKTLLRQRATGRRYGEKCYIGIALRTAQGAVLQRG